MAYKDGIKALWERAYKDGIGTLGKGLQRWNRHCWKGTTFISV